MFDSMNQILDINVYFVGNYGLISFGPSDTSQTLTIPVSRRNRNNDELREQCLLYYYYMTFESSSSSRNQSINVYMLANSIPSNPILIDTITWADMKQNRWQNRIVKVNSSSDSYQVHFSNILKEIIIDFFILVKVYFQC